MEHYFGDMVTFVLDHGLFLGTILTLVVCGLGIPIPEEAVFLTVGMIGATKHADLTILCLAGLIGIVAGDSIPFFVGRHYGLDFLTRWKFLKRLISPKNVEKTRSFFGTHGPKAIFIARFIAGVRMPAFFMAGTMGMAYPTFFIWDFLGALISCPTSICLAYYFGPKAKVLLDESKVYVFIALGILAAYLVYHVWAHSHKEPDDDNSGGEAKKDDDSTQKKNNDDDSTHKKDVESSELKAAIAPIHLHETGVAK